MGALGVAAFVIILAAMVIQAVIPSWAVDALRDAYFSIVHHAMTALLTIKMK